jgi:hypothetical protein
MDSLSAVPKASFYVLKCHVDFQMLPLQSSYQEVNEDTRHTISYTVQPYGELEKLFKLEIIQESPSHRNIAPFYVNICRNITSDEFPDQSVKVFGQNLTSAWSFAPDVGKG